MPDATEQDIDDARQRVDALRAEVEQEKANRAAASVEASNATRLEQLTTEEDRLKAELRVLRGEEPEVASVDGYEVPAGTISVDTDVVSVAADGEGDASAPQLPPPPPAPSTPSVPDTDPAPAGDDDPEV